MTKSAAPKNIVFYADDDLDDLELVQEAFSRYSNNIEVVTARDGSQALAFLQNLEKEDVLPCLIILDINMPVLNGKEVLKHIRKIEHMQSVPAILFTTSSQPMDKVFAERYNAGFITKPLDMNQMDMITETFVDHCTDETKKNIRRQMK